MKKLFDKNVKQVISLKENEPNYAIGQVKFNADWVTDQSATFYPVLMMKDVKMVINTENLL